MVISINSRFNVDSGEQNTTTTTTTSKPTKGNNDDDLNTTCNCNVTTTTTTTVNDEQQQRNLVNFHLNDSGSTTPDRPITPLIHQTAHDSITYCNSTPPSHVVITPQSLPDSNNNDLINEDDDDDDFIKLAQKQLIDHQEAQNHVHRSKSCESLNQYVEPNGSWNLWNYFFNNQDIIEEIETKIFSANPQCKVKRNFVNIYNKSLRIWTLSTNIESKNTPIVLIHGFCGGLGLWVHNVKVLSKSRPLYAFDLLGFGRSSRPSFSSDATVSEVQFIESIEDWRKELNIKEMILLGHSFGGYLASAYAIKYPEHTKALLLIDPWGFHELPTTPKPDTPEPMWVRLITNVSRYVSPLSVLRTTGPIGVPMFKFLKPDFKRKYKTILGSAGSDLIYNYLYHCNREYPSGEDGFRAVSDEQFGFAKNPMIKRIEKVSSKIPIWFVYGSRSWVDSSSGFSTKYIRNRFAYVSIKIIPGAGHYVYADKPDLFNDYVNEILDLIDSHNDDNQNSYPTSSTCSSSLLNCN